ncbi:MAG TPA: GNAT family N-acetyltransferase [Tepidisphaeraceae bacterium]|nr:GNAT family N-acetyltransferase [Tepidisphaeraceae bacterium]
MEASHELLAREQRFFDEEAAELSAEELSVPDASQVARYQFASDSPRNLSKDALFARLLPLNGKKVLDYGCGQGENACLLAACGADVSAFDLSPRSVEQARMRAVLHHLDDRIDFRVCAAGQTAYPDDFFDVVTGFAILHHLHTVLPMVFEEIHRVLKPGGVAAFIEPVANSPMLRFLRRITPIPCYATPDERQLTYHDFEPLRRSFSGIEFLHFDFVGRLRRFAGLRQVRAFRRIDYGLERALPFLRRYYGTVVVFAMVEEKMALDQSHASAARAESSSQTRDSTQRDTEPSTAGGRYVLLDPAQARLKAGWLESVQREPKCSVFLHPQLDSEPGSGYRVLANGELAQDHARTCVYGVLAPKVVRLKLLPGLRFTAKLKGYRLVGNQFIGDPTGDDLSAMVEAITQPVRRAQCDCILFEDIEMDSPLHTAICQHASSRRNLRLHYPAKPQPHWWIEFPERPEDYWKKFSKKSRYNLRAAAKKLDHTLHRFTTAKDALKFLELAHRVSKASWQARRIGLRITNSAREKRWYQQVAEIGALRSYVLEHKGNPVAFVVGLQWKETFSYEEVGYDSAFADRSPGTVLLFRLIEDLIAIDTPKSLDFGFGDGEYKRVFGTRQTQSGPIAAMGGHFRPRVVVQFAKVGTTLRTYVDNSLSHLGMRSTLRQLYRR